MRSGQIVLKIIVQIIIGIFRITGVGANKHFKILLMIETLYFRRERTGRPMRIEGGWIGIGVLIGIAGISTLALLILQHKSIHELAVAVQLPLGGPANAPARINLWLPT